MTKLIYERRETILHPVSLHERPGETTIETMDAKDWDSIIEGAKKLKPPLYERIDELVGRTVEISWSYPWQQDPTQTVTVVYTFQGYEDDRSSEAEVTEAQTYLGTVSVLDESDGHGPIRAEV
jgi:hypothetical protein